MFYFLTSVLLLSRNYNKRINQISNYKKADKILLCKNIIVWYKWATTAICWVFSTTTPSTKQLSLSSPPSITTSSPTFWKPSNTNQNIPIWRNSSGVNFLFAFANKWIGHTTIFTTIKWTSICSKKKEPTMFPEYCHQPVLGNCCQITANCSAKGNKCFRMTSRKLEVQFLTLPFSCRPWSGKLWPLSVKLSSRSRWPVETWIHPWKRKLFSLKTKKLSRFSSSVCKCTSTLPMPTFHASMKTMSISHK